MFSRPRDDSTRRYLCAGRRPGHQLAIVARPLDELVAERVLVLLATPLFRETMLAGADGIDDPSVGRVLSDLGAAQGRLQCLDDDFYVRGVLAEGRYRSTKGQARTRDRSTPRPGRRRHQAAHRSTPRSSHLLGDGGLPAEAGAGAARCRSGDRDAGASGCRAGSILPGSGSSSRTRRRTAQVRRVRPWRCRSRSGILLHDKGGSRSTG